MVLEETEVKTEENEEPQRPEEEEEEVEPNEILTDLDEAGVEALASEGRETILGLKKRDKGKKERKRTKKKTYLVPNRTWLPPLLEKE